VQARPGPERPDHGLLAARLALAGCVAADEEAEELLAATATEPERLEELVRRREEGEPLAWLTGVVRFCGHDVLVETGVFVPRWQSEPLAREAARLLPEDGVAVDLGTGAGAIALTLGRARPGATVLATELDPSAARCARSNGVAVVEGDLFDGLDPSLRGAVDVVVGVLPYVPTGSLHLLPSDSRRYEPLLALDGGPAGISQLDRACTGAAGYLRQGGALLLELGAGQAAPIERLLRALRFSEPAWLVDDEGELRGVVATLGS
jgi:release factor glutamine methyltransferase